MGNSDIDTQSRAENPNIIQAMATGWHRIRNFARKENYTTCRYLHTKVNYLISCYLTNNIS